MAIDAISSVAALDDSKSTKSLSKLANDFESFLKLLTVQLKNQDPTSPMETNEFTQQLIGFSSVEQQVASNKNLEKLISLSQNSMISNAVSYIDKFAEAETDKFNLRSGKFVASYQLPIKAENLTVTVTDKLGKVIAKITPEGAKLEPGKKQTIVWDGNDLSGQPVKDGEYKLNVSGKDSKGREVKGTTYVTDLVTAVDLEGDAGTTIYFEGVKLDLSDVRAIKSGFSQTAAE